MIKRSEDEVRSLYKKLMNESEVAREFGISRQSAYDYRVRHAIPYDPKVAKKKTYNVLYKERNEQIISMYLSGVPMEKICKKFSMNAPAINYILLKHKVKKPVVHPSYTRNMEIFKLRQEGVTISELAKKYDLDSRYLSSMIFKIKRKLKGEKK